MPFQSRSDYATGVLLLVIAAATYSTAGLFTKGVIASAWAVIFWRGLFAATLTTAWAFQQGKLRENFVQMGHAGWAVGVIGALGTAAFIPAFKLTTIANVSLIYAVAPLIAALLAWITLNERPTSQTLLGSALAFVGVIIIVSGSIGHTNLIGDSLALGMTVAMAVIMVIYRMRPMTPGAGPSVLQSVFLLPPSLLLGAPFQSDPFEIAVLAVFGLLFAIASVSLAEGAKRVPSGQAALIGALETPLAPVLAFIVFAERPGATTIIGGMAVLAAVILAISGKDRFEAA